MGHGLFQLGDECLQCGDVDDVLSPDLESVF